MHNKSGTALWNPIAITLWSVPFSLLFGAWLHIHNWTALGEPDKADNARRWFNALLIIMVLNGVITAIAERTAMSVNPADFISIGVFLLWYLLAAHRRGGRAGLLRLLAPDLRPAGVVHLNDYSEFLCASFVELVCHRFESGENHAGHR